MSLAPRRFGDSLREWRQRRRLTQLELSNATGISARHLSFIETGRSQPSRAMILRLAEHLQVPLRARNELFAPRLEPSGAARSRGVDNPVSIEDIR